MRKQGLGLAAISYDTPAVLSHFAKRKGISFPLLSDPDSKIIRAFGVLNESVPRDSFAFGVPHPVTFVVSRTGEVRSKHFDEDYRQRYTMANILTGQFNARAGNAATEVETRHLKLSASSSNSVIRAGERIRLLVDVKLRPKMHVYAPGSEGYRPINWMMKESEAWIAHPIKIPASKKRYLRAIKETVPVLERSFTLEREITIAGMQKLKPALTENSELVVEGTLEYQACDDHQCYLPEKVPLSWKLKFVPHDPERVPEPLRRAPVKQP